MIAYHIQHKKSGLLKVAGIVSFFGEPETVRSNAAVFTVEAAELIMILCLRGGVETLFELM